MASGAYDLAMAIGVEKLKDSGYLGPRGIWPAGDGTDAPVDRPPPSRSSFPAYAQKYGVDPTSSRRC